LNGSFNHSGAITALVEAKPKGTETSPRRQRQSNQSEITLAHLIFQSDPSENEVKNQFVT
jgi:hypothetical protein